MFGNPETTPGGRALKFYSSVRLDIRRIETLKDGVEAFGNRVRVKVVKNKVAPPFKQAEFDIIYGSGISWEGTVLDTGLERKVVTKSGSYFSFGDERLGQGRQNATAFLREHPDVTQQILQADPGRDLGPDQIVSARLLPVAGEEVRERATARRRWRRRRSRRPKPRRDARSSPALRERKRSRVAVELDGRPWRVAAGGCGGTGRASRSADRSIGPRRGSSPARSAVRGPWPRRRGRSLRPRRSRGELEQRLARAGHAGAAREDALETLDRAGLVDDARLAERPRRRARAPRLRRCGDSGRPPAAPDRSRGRRRRGRRPRARTRHALRRQLEGKDDHAGAPAAARRARLLTRHARCERRRGLRKRPESGTIRNAFHSTFCLQKQLFRNHIR